LGGHDRTNIRELVLDCLMEVLEEGTYSHVILNNVLNKYAYLPKKDRAYYTIVFQGTLERLITIDYILDRYSRTPVAKMKPVIRNLLRSAVYQILYLEGTPDSVVVNETVKLAGKRGFKGLQGFVNGLLRNISRSKEALPWPEEDKDLTAYLSVKYSVPCWIVDKWLGVYDRESVEGILAASMSRPDTVIRIRPSTDMTELKSRMESEGITMTPTELDNAYVISGFDRITDVPGMTEGKFQIQDLSSIRVGDLIEKYRDTLQKGTSDNILLNALDMCAAPGGKSLHLRDLGYNVTSCDVSEKKLSLIRENFQRAGIMDREASDVLTGDRIQLKVRDGRQFDPEMAEAYDLVLADAPCSGLGVLGRKADIKYRLEPDSLTEVAKLQSEILENAMKYVKKDGLLVFSTCTINKDENEFHRDMIVSSGMYRLAYEEQRLPGRDSGDGFYISIYTRIR